MSGAPNSAGATAAMPLIRAVATATTGSEAISRTLKAASRLAGQRAVRRPVPRGAQQRRLGQPGEQARAEDGEGGEGGEQQDVPRIGARS